MIALHRRIAISPLIVWMIILLGYIGMIVIGLPMYLKTFPVNSLLGITAILFTWEGAKKRKRMFGGVLFVCALLLLYHRMPSKFVLYTAIGISLFLLIENRSGNAGPLAMFCLILMSPLFEYFAIVFGFPVRLQLTQIAGQILHIADSGYHSEGNTLFRGTTEFSVDEACMGLHMFSSSMLTGMILTGMYQRRLGKKVSLIILTVIGTAILILNLFSNLIRIICLVQFKISPENSLHAAAGLGCFVIYILLPAVFIVKYMTNRYGKKQDLQKQSFELNVKELAIHLVLLLLIFISVSGSRHQSVNSRMVLATVTAPGYKIENLQEAIVKLSTDKELVYLKPIIGFYSSDHQPTICWKGSGYEFTKLETCSLDGQMFYTSCLEKGTEKLYTSWWYDNGEKTTISQFNWRWDSFKNNQPWVLVNATAGSKPELLDLIRKIRKINPCRKMLSQ